jgi:UDP-glucose 6-dehydrogenase
MPDRAPIGVIGVGWVGLVSSACFAELGHEVWCRDIDGEKIDALRNGNVPIFEPTLTELVHRNAERLHFESDLAPVLEHARLLFVCVDTPPTYSGDADLSRVEAVIEELPASPKHAIVMKSTVPVGTGKAIKRRLRELGKEELGYASNPEFLREGSAVSDFMHPDRVAVGSDGPGWPGDDVAKLYEALDCEIVRTDVASAEMIKLASNAFLATKISFINEIANVCEEVGADVDEVAIGMGLDNRIGPNFLSAGIGYGGSCLVGEETLFVRQHGEVRFTTLEELFRDSTLASGAVSAVRPDELEVLSWRENRETPEFLPVEALTRRTFEGEVLEVSTNMGASVRSTPDHPFVVGDPESGETTVKLGEHLGFDDWLPIAPGASDPSVVTERDSDVRATLEGPDVLGETESAQVAVALPAGTTAATLESSFIAWTRVTGIRPSPFSGFVYSLEVPDTHTFVTTGGLVVHNCFPKDVAALKQLAGNTGYHFQLLTAVIEVNELQKRRVVSKLKKHLGSLVGTQIALLGLAFKPNTDDMREASSVVLAARLQGEGARVRAYDPVAEQRARELITGAELCDTALDALAGADAVVIVTEWPEFAELDLAEVKARMRRPLIVDGRNLLSPEEARAAGFVYESIGRP